MNAPLATLGVDRSRFLGGSDVAAVMGLSPWRTAVDLFFDKISPRSDAETIDPEKQRFFARRKRQEPVVAEMLADEYGIEVTRLSLDGNPNRYLDQDHDFLAAEIDFEFVMTEAVREHFLERPEFCAIPDGTIINGEIKTVHPFKASEWGEQGSEDVPIHYAAQVMHGLGVTRRPAAVVAALFGLDNLLCFPVMTDPETIASMRAKCVAFWTENVLKRIPPEPVNLGDIKRLYYGAGGKPVELDEEAFNLLHTVEMLRGRERQAKDDRTEVEFRLAKFIADQWGVPLINEDGKPVITSDSPAALTYAGIPVGTWNRQRGTYLDQRRLKAEKPAITAAYTVEHHYRLFRLKQEKGKR